MPEKPINLTALDPSATIPTQQTAMVALLHGDYLFELEDDFFSIKDFLLVKTPELAFAHGCAAILLWHEGKLALQSFQDDHFTPVTIDWSFGKSDYRRRQGGRAEMIAKAVGVKKDYLPTVVDSTAGLGQDSFVLASIGCPVTMVERSPAVRALLWDALRRAKNIEELTDIASRMTLVANDSRDYLRDLEHLNRPDVVYCDPMFPERNKSALVKKEMRVFKNLVGEDRDATDLLAQALLTAKKRVVVKRPLKAPVIEGPQPSHSLLGKACRFDVYMLKPI